MRQCKNCDEPDFEYVHGSVWKCKNCGTLSGDTKDLEELKEPVQRKKEKKKKRKLTSYQKTKFTCDLCKTIIFHCEYYCFT